MLFAPPGAKAAEWIDAPAPTAHDLLVNVFRLAHSMWARSFLFSPNPNDDAGILSSPLHLQHKVSGQINLAMRAERVGPYATDPYDDMADPSTSTSADDRLNADWVQIPAFTLGQQTASYFMHKHNKGPLQDNNGAVRSALYRNLTDDVTGESLCVGDMADTDRYQVIFMKHVTGSLHERAVCFLEGSVFRAAVAAADDELPIAQIAKAMSMCIHTREARVCITCGAPPAASCMCKVVMRQAEFPNDMRFHGFNARTHLGNFQGKQHLMYIRDGFCIFRRAQLTRHCTNDAGDRAVANRLREWAVQDRLGNVTPRGAMACETERLVAQAMVNSEHKSFDQLVDDLADLDRHIVIPDTTCNVVDENGSGEVDITRVTPSPAVHQHSVICINTASFAAAPIATNVPAITDDDRAMQSTPQDRTIVAPRPAPHAMRSTPQDRTLVAPRPAPHAIHALTTEQMTKRNELVMQERYNEQSRQAQHRLAQRLMEQAQYMQYQEGQQRQSTSPRGIIPQQLAQPTQQSAAYCTSRVSGSVEGLSLGVSVDPTYRPTAIYTTVRPRTACASPFTASLSPTAPDTCIVDSRQRARRMAPVAPRPPVRERLLLPRGVRPVTPVISKQDRELSLRIRKREAARRSDQRRLKRVQQLHDETQKLETLAGELRTRVAKLKDVNSELRHQVATLGLLRR